MKSTQLESDPSVKSRQALFIRGVTLLTAVVVILGLGFVLSGRVDEVAQDFNQHSVN